MTVPIDDFKWRIDDLQNGFSDFSSALPEKEKPFAPYETQIAYLKAKGCQIGDEEACQRKLREVTYYRLKGYLQRRPGNGYIPFKSACRLEEFDARMRALLFYALSRIEVCLRSQISYFYSSNKGPYGYLDKTNYPSEQNYRRFLNIVKSREEENASTPFVKHYLEKHHGIMPFWALSEILTFGHWVEFYRDWAWADKKALISQFYGTDTKFHRQGSQKIRIAKSAENNPRFLSWLLSCRNLRNVCAHCGRLSYRTFPWNTNLPDEYRNTVTKKNEKKLWEKILAVQFLYPDPEEWTNEIVPQMKALLLDAFRKGNRLDNRSIMAALGFPADWETLLKKWETL